MLELKNITFEADGKTILDDISLKLTEHALTVITGPNGGGKSTLAKLIMGIEHPTKGSIFFNGEDITDLSIDERAKRGIGYAFQQPPRFKGMSVRRLLELARACCKEVNPDIHVYEGRVVSGDQFVSSQEKKEWLIRNFKGSCTEMEGAAIAQAAYLNGIPFLIIRAISDKADNSATMDYPAFEAQAIDHSVNLMLEMIRRYEA